MQAHEETSRRDLLVKLSGVGLTKDEQWELARLQRVRRYKEADPKPPAYHPAYHPAGLPWGVVTQ